MEFYFLGSFAFFDTLIKIIFVTINRQKLDGHTSIQKFKDESKTDPKSSQNDKPALTPIQLIQISAIIRSRLYWNDFLGIIVLSYTLL